MMREPYFTWPEDWILGSCGATGQDHLRRPGTVGPKEPHDIHVLVVGLNPGHWEVRRSAYFVGPAGRYFRTNARWEPFWVAIGQANQVIVTNLVKFSTRGEAGLEGDRRVPGCVRGCFLAEVRALPNLAKIYLLGDEAWRFFEEFAWPEMGGVDVYRLRHPSFSWTPTEEVFNHALGEDLAEPYLAAAHRGAGPKE
jgi:uracil-DNA glycosylase